MTDQPPQTILPPPPAGSLPEFRPVPREKDRANGWKPEVQRAFIEALAETGSVRSACRKVGRSEVGAYLIRRHPQAADFRAAWDAALDIGMRRIEDVAPSDLRSKSAHLGTARSTGSRSRCTPTASSSAAARSTTTGW